MQEIKIDSCQCCQMYVDIYTTLTVLALLVAPYIYDISRLRVNWDFHESSVLFMNIIPALWVGMLCVYVCILFFLFFLITWL